MSDHRENYERARAAGLLNIWLIAGTPIDEPYPCMCRHSPCRYQYCPCWGRTDDGCMVEHDEPEARRRAAKTAAAAGASDGHSGDCPLCGADHAGCRWTAGSLWCVNDPCGNPHHRSGDAA